MHFQEGKYKVSIFLETERLILKEPSFDSLEDLYALQADLDTMRYIGNGVRTREEVREGLKKMLQHFEKHGFGLGDIFEKASGTYIGRAGLIYLAFDDTQPEIEVGYQLHKAFWNRGYATELTKALINWGFQHLAIEHLVAVIRPENERSRHVLEKVGMRYIGRTIYYDKEVAKYQILKNDIDYNEIKLVPASIDDYPILQNMSNFYAYDISEYMQWSQAEDGTLDIGLDFIKYWQVEDCYPFLIRYQDELVGFAIVDKQGTDNTIDFNMAQFFILRKFKNKGIGRLAAYYLFRKFAGVWEVSVIPGNEGAYRFWRSIIKSYNSNEFEEYTIPNVNGYIRNIFKFNSNS
jgi:RimJ/RimL family protein N-acetyltransferase/predicted acetyltransferase